ncbi:hypothetical protein AMECASPLE_019185 [Ameca splendens]|uniref:Uncharacterized protein n=1 Tax=Ameca splendens TaxID=208324 RepID=A0ABV1AAQ7_9TELE
MYLNGTNCICKAAKSTVTAVHLRSMFSAFPLLKTSSSPVRATMSEPGCTQLPVCGCSAAELRFYCTSRVGFSDTGETGKLCRKPGMNFSLSLIIGGNVKKLVFFSPAGTLPQIGQAAQKHLQQARFQCLKDYFIQNDGACGTKWTIPWARKAKIKLSYCVFYVKLLFIPPCLKAKHNPCCFFVFFVFWFFSFGLTDL